MMKYLAVTANAVVLVLMAAWVFHNGIPGDEQIRLFAVIAAATILSLVVLLRHRNSDAKYKKWLDDESARLRRELATGE